MKFCVLVTPHLYRTDFKAFPLFAEKPPKLLPFSDILYLFSLLSAYFSKNQSTREIDVYVSIIKTSSRSAISVMLSLCKKNNTICLYSPFYLKLFHPSVSPELQLFFFFLILYAGVRSPTATTQSLLKSMAFAQIQPRAKARVSQIT